MKKISITTKQVQHNFIYIRWGSYFFLFFFFFSRGLIQFKASTTAMKITCISSLLPLIASVISAPVKWEQWEWFSTEVSFPIRLYSNNIRYATTTLQTDETPWEDRKTMCINSIRYNAKDRTIVALQEALHNQIEDIMTGLGNDWSYYGVGRDDGKEEGEYAPILYRNDQWDMINNHTWWLSQTPNVVSKGWDAAHHRVLTWVHLQNKNSHHKINVFNTHLDDQGVIARTKSAKLILKKIKQLKNKDPVFLLGDFNSQPSDGAYKTISKSKALKDSSLQASYKFGDEKTYTGFNDNDISKQTRIDYIFTPSKGVDVNTYSVLHSKYLDEYFSDHRPLSVDVALGYK